MNATIKQPGITPAQWGVIGLIVSFTAGGLLYKLLMHEQLGHSAAMFLGVPAVLAILLALTPQAKTATGGILKGITLALLVIAPLLGEGYVCILMAAPLFYLVGVIMGLLIDRHRRKRDATLSCMAFLLVPLCLEGVFPPLTFNRFQSIEARQIVPARADAVELALTQSMNVNTKLPTFLRIGFPRPLAAWGQGLAVGDTRTVHFSGAEGDPPGDLVMRVAERNPGYVRFETVSDGSKLTQWVRWASSSVAWKALDADHTLVTWRIQFERQLDPAWYFTPSERAAVKEAATYLIDANTPAGSTNGGN
jgi:hypothetical protein